MFVLFPSDVNEIVLGRLNVLVSLRDEGGEIIYANDNVTELFGYLPGELITSPERPRSVDDLVPDDVRKTHREHRLRFIASPSERAMGERLTLKGKKKDGTLFSVRIHLIPCVIRGIDVTVATIFAMT